VTLSVHSCRGPVVALSLFLALSASTLALNGWSEQKEAQSASAASAGDIVASIAGSTEARIADGVIEARWQVRNGKPEGLEIRDVRDGHVLRLDGPFKLALADDHIVAPATMTLLKPARVEPLAANPDATVAAERLPGTSVHYQLEDPAGRFQVDWAVVMRQNSHYIRQVVTIRAGKEDVAITRVSLIDATAIDALAIDATTPGMRTEMRMTGTVKGTPLTAGNFFLGFEHPLSTSSVVHGRGVAEMERVLPLRAGQAVTYSSVVGVAAPGQMRRDFLAYIERERAHPYRTFLHYNSWYDIGYENRYTQAQAVERIHTFGRELHDKRGVTLDSFMFDDGWDDTAGMWAFRKDFTNGFLPLKDAAAQYGTAPGVWLSPWGGYAHEKQERIAEGRKEGYEIENGGFALSGPKYYARFHEICMEMVKKYGVNQFKFDGTGNVDTVVKGSAFDSDFDAAIHLIGDLRQVKPDLYINLTTGTYPSPFWLMYADSIWRGGDDHSFAGVGPERERWITYRDMDVYDEIVKGGSLFPLNSLMLHGLIWGQYAHHLGTDKGHDFKNEVRDYFGTGTQLQEMYITPALLAPSDWDVLAEAAKWSRANAGVLKDTHWVGGDPRWLEVYGWASWTPEKAILTLRNPSDKPQDFQLDAGKAFELPPTAERRFRAHSPWKDEADTPPVELKAGVAHTFHLKPFEVLTLDATPE
jgi:hypothetical protein